MTGSGSWLTLVAIVKMSGPAMPILPVVPICRTRPCLPRRASHNQPLAHAEKPIGHTKRKAACVVHKWPKSAFGFSARTPMNWRSPAVEAMVR